MNIQRSLQFSCNVLSAAQAPQNWRRKLSGEISRLGDLQRGCSWVDDLASTNIKLRDEPLLGSCLESLLGVREQTPKIQPKITPPRKLQTEFSQPSRKQKPSHCPPQIKAKETTLVTPASQAIFTPLQLAAKVNQEKLCNFARDYSRTNSRTHFVAKEFPKTECKQNSTLKSQALLLKQQLKEPIKPSPKPPTSTKNVSQNADFYTCTITDIQQQWLRKKSRDAYHSLYRKQLTKYLNSPVSVFNQTQEEQEEAEKAYSNQFALPLDGKTASWELLVNLASVQNKISNHQNSNYQNSKSRNSSITSSSKKSDKPSLTPEAYRQKSEPKSSDIFPQNQYPFTPTIPTDNRKISQSRTIPNISPSKAFVSYATEVSSNKPATTTTPINSLAEAVVIPTPSSKAQDINLPLSSPQHEETTKVNSTSELNQQIIKQKESPLDDLNLLADKIKQILDEEARRHGINV